MLRRLIVPLAFAVALSACSPGPSSTFNPHTGITRHASAPRVIERQPAAEFAVQVVGLEGHGEERLAILTSVRRADGNFPRIDGAWSHGHALPYRKMDRRYLGCGSALGCVREEAGAITITRNLALAALRNGGLDLHLSGRRGAYTGRVPPELFAEMLARFPGR